MWWYVCESNLNRVDENAGVNAAVSVEANVGVSVGVNGGVGGNASAGQSSRMTAYAPVPALAHAPASCWTAAYHHGCEQHLRVFPVRPSKGWASMPCIAAAAVAAAARGWGGGGPIRAVVDSPDEDPCGS